ncbi:hypothetical protein TIFTF001_023178 [Ficus carica]|uniref:SHSP domain-containing protein n=1 Tax=Ficus carica TaxID=3494 RepID=A0AA88AWM0_FICCA|nr:hypothetical protein TIFTF001_023178 [Ficus carica]
MAACLKSSYEDFEPFCQWQRGQERDVLEVHLQGFKIEHLRVQLNNYGILTISGEQALQDSRISRFRKEIKVAKEYSADQIRAKFSSGILYIILPNVSIQSSSAPHDHSAKSAQIREENTTSATSCGPKSVRQTTSRLKDGMLRIEISTKMAVSIAIVFAAGIAVGGYLIWRW